MAGSSEDCTDIFPVADFDAYRLGCVVVARMFQKIGWSERWCTRIVHGVKTLGRIAMSGCHRQSEMERTIEDCRGCGKMDCGRGGWTADPHFSTFATQRKDIGRIRGCFDGKRRNNGRPKKHVILGASLYGMTDFFHVGVSSDSLRARALHTMVTELDLTVTNTWMNADTERELFTQSSWSNPEDSLTQMDSIMTSRKLHMKQVQVLDSDWFKTDHRAVLAVLSLRPKMRYTMRNGANLRGWSSNHFC